MTEEMLYGEKNNCCGCGACVNICPKNAISLFEDESGFLYPKIDKEKCINCGLCKKNCAYQNNENLQKSIKTYAAMCSDDNILINSASGGVFAALAREFINDEGIVYGCSLEKEEENLVPKIIRIDNVDDIQKIQGSKYVKSLMLDTYINIKSDLKNGKKVLFSGLPCQISALKRFLQSINTDNLFTIDIICHGTPSIKFFNDYLKLLEKKLQAKIYDFKFRDKSEGWGLKGKVYYYNKYGKPKNKLIMSNLSSYYSLFLKSEIYQESCYSCKYARQDRTGDMTIGDFWGIEKTYPNYLMRNGGELDNKKGISCILVNTEQGKKLVDNYSRLLLKKSSTLENIILDNEQLNKPSKMSSNRDYILKVYRQEGYEAVERYFISRLGKKRNILFIWDRLPRNMQLIIKRIFKNKNKKKV